MPVVLQDSELFDTFQWYVVVGVIICYVYVYIVFDMDTWVYVPGFWKQIFNPLMNWVILENRIGHSM